MKKFLLFFAFVGMSLCLKGQVFQQGDMVADLGIGIGLADVVKITGNGLNVKAKQGSVAAISQKIAFEYGIFQFGKSTIGIGGIISNSCGLGYDTKVSGKYDYSYDIFYYHKKNNRWSRYDTKTKHRKGEGVANGTGRIDDINIMLKGSYHYNVNGNIETYATLGFGVSLYNMKFSPSDDEDGAIGLSKGGHDLDHSWNAISQPVYHYNDFEHTEWENSSNHARLAMAVCVGLRYYFTPTWAVNGEFGLTSASFKKDCNVYNLLTVGVSYKF
ncbi:MAG: porin family protein [Duncaniella sp.]|nr:porin family protein [Duncaniella sp.]MDE5751605.1 porin family protein [Duncaniella sp.]